MRFMLRVITYVYILNNTLYYIFLGGINEKDNLISHFGCIFKFCCGSRCPGLGGPELS